VTGGCELRIVFAGLSGWILRMWERERRARIKARPWGKVSRGGRTRPHVYSLYKKISPKTARKPHLRGKPRETAFFPRLFAHADWLELSHPAKTFLRLKPAYLSQAYSSLRAAHISSIAECKFPSRPYLVKEMTLSCEPLSALLILSVIQILLPSERGSSMRCPSPRH
jgi:hypothetical protein